MCLTLNSLFSPRGLYYKFYSILLCLIMSYSKKVWKRYHKEEKRFPNAKQRQVMAGNGKQSNGWRVNGWRETCVSITRVPLASVLIDYWLVSSISSVCLNYSAYQTRYFSFSTNQLRCQTKKAFFIQKDLSNASNTRCRAIRMKMVVGFFECSERCGSQFEKVEGACRYKTKIESVEGAPSTCLSTKLVVSTSLPVT